MSRNKNIEEVAEQMLASGEYEFVTVLDLLDELSDAGHQVSQEEVAECMDGMAQNSEWTWEPMPDNPVQRLYTKGFHPNIELAVEEVGQIRIILCEKYSLNRYSSETWEIAAQIQRNMILKQAQQKSYSIQF